MVSHGDAGGRQARLILVLFHVGGDLVVSEG